MVIERSTMVLRKVERDCAARSTLLRWPNQSCEMRTRPKAFTTGWAPIFSWTTPSSPACARLTS